MERFCGHGTSREAILEEQWSPFYCFFFTLPHSFSSAVFNTLFIMKTTFIAFLATSLCTSLVAASPFPHGAAHTTPRSTGLATRASCDNTATSRDCWGDYSIDTNYYETTVTTGVTRGIVSHSQKLYHGRLMLCRVLAHSGEHLYLCC